MNRTGSYTYYYLSMIVIYVVSRLFFMDLQFDIESIYSHWQILDIEWLQKDLFGSLYYLHSQPPFYNLLIGVLAKLFPDTYMQVLSALSLVMSLAIYAMMFRILLFFRVSAWLSLAASTFYILTPEALLYEHWVFYTWFNAFLLVSATFFLTLYFEKRRSLYLFLFFLSLAILMLTRSMFHLVFLPPVVFFLVMMDRQNWGRIIGFSLVPLVLVGGVYLKNYQSFGFFGGSSWLGMNISKVVIHATLDHPLSELMQMPYAQKEKEMKENMEKLYSEGKIHSPMLVGGFKSLESYDSPYQGEIPNRYRELSVLTEPLKSTGYRNFNHYNYLTISQDMKTDALVIIAEHPMGYIRTVAMAMMNYIRPSWDYLFVEENVKKMDRYMEAFELGHLGGTLKGKYGLVSVLLIPLAILFTMIYTGFLLYRKINDRGAVALFMIFTTLFVMIIGVLVEIGELNRMRVMTDPLLFMLTVSALMAGSRFIFSRVKK